MTTTPDEFRQSYRREQILRAAREVIGEQGFSRTSVDQIAKRAGLSRTTVYEYFPNKGEILRGCLAAGGATLWEAMGRRIDREAPIAAQLKGFFEVCLAHVDANREFFRAVAALGSVASIDGELGFGELGDLLKDVDDELNRILDDGFEHGDLPQPVDPALRSCLGMLIAGAVATRGRLEESPPVEQSAAELVRFALPAFVAPRD